MQRIVDNYNTSIDILKSRVRHEYSGELELNYLMILELIKSIYRKLKDKNVSCKIVYRYIIEFVDENYDNLISIFNSKSKEKLILDLFFTYLSKR